MLCCLKDLFGNTSFGFIFFVLWEPLCEECDRVLAFFVKLVDDRVFIVLSAKSSVRFRRTSPLDRGWTHRSSEPMVIA